MVIKNRIYWFYMAIFMSVVVRIYLAVFTDGTYDIGIWEKHAVGITRFGLTDYYAMTLGEVTTFNHPPIAGKLVTALYNLGIHAGIPFKVIFRLLVASTDYLTAYYLFKLTGPGENRYFYVAAYLLNPLTFIFSAYHGNTDPLLGFFILLSLFLLDRKKLFAAGVALGIGVWIKWIILLVLPLVIFSIRGYKAKGSYLSALVMTTSVGYSWYLIHAPDVILKSVFAYGGQQIQTTGGIPIWGNMIPLRWFLSRFASSGSEAYLWRILDCNSIIVAGSIVAYSWLQRGRASGKEACRTVGEVFIIFYAVTNFWSFQYLAWSAPFLVFLPTPLFAATAVSLSAFIYSLYSLVCNSLFLRGAWNFVDYPYLSPAVLFFRNAAIAVVLASALYLFRGATRQYGRAGNDNA